MSRASMSLIALFVGCGGSSGPAGANQPVEAGAATTLEGGPFRDDAAIGASEGGAVTDRNDAPDIGDAAGDDGPPSIGDVAGTPFVVRSAFARSVAPAQGYPILEIVVATAATAACAPVQGAEMTLSLFIYNTRDQTPVGPGTYPIAGQTDAGLSGDAYFHSYGPMCPMEVFPYGLPRDGGFPKSGVIAISSVTPTVSGSFEAIADGAHLAGAFDAPLCGPDAGVDGHGCP
jgi:hypothetical protein